MTFVKGKSGNPGGKPEQKPFLDALRLAINRAHGDRRRLDTVASMLIAKAEQGDVQAILAIADRLDGKPVQQTENHNINENVFALVSEVSSQDEWSSMIAEIRESDTKIVHAGNGKHNGNGATKAATRRPNGH